MKYHYLNHFCVISAQEQNKHKDAPPKKGYKTLAAQRKAEIRIENLLPRSPSKRKAIVSELASKQ